ncbi:MAG: carbohydrate ABC transporter permease, partial [Chloroflexota bacterium]
PLILPNFFGSAFSIFLLRQYFMTIPLELDDAAKIDGAGYFRIFTNIILPTSTAALGVVAVFEFLESWRDFFGPLIYLTSDAKYTVPIGLYTFQTEYFTEWHLFMAASALAMLVPLLVFFVAQKYFIGGIALVGSGGSKG